MFSPFVVSRDAAPDHDSNRAIRQRRLMQRTNRSANIAAAI
jgi:hypothetical protein